MAALFTKLSVFRLLEELRFPPFTARAFKLGVTALSLGVGIGCGDTTTAHSTWPAWRDGGESAKVLEVEETATTCRQCVVVTPRTLIAIDSGLGIVDESNFVIVDSVNRTWVSTSSGIKVYSAEGVFVKKVGTRGSGPLEFQAPGPMYIDALDQVHVFDQLSFRETSISPNFELVGSTTHTFGPILSVASHSQSDSIVVNTSLLDADKIAQPLHWVRRGEIVKSFGQPPDSLFLATSAHFERKIALTRDDFVVTANRYAYQIELHSSSGARRLSFSRLGLWDPPVGGLPTARTLSDQLSGFVQGVTVDDSDRLFVLVWTPKPNWRSLAQEKLLPDGGKMIVRKDDRVSLYQTRIDVIDLSTGKLLGTSVLDDLVWGLLGPERAYGYRYDEEGEPTLAIFTVKFGRPNPS